MKKAALLIMTLTFVFSCGSSAVVNEARKTINGDWQLTSIDHPGNEENLQVTLLNDVPSQCLENSTWAFVSNNNTGSYEPSGLTCDSTRNFFIWSVTEMNATQGNYNLMFKPTDEDYNSTTGNQGYRLNLVHVSGDQMVWEQTITFEGEPFTIRMNFNRI